MGRNRIRGFLIKHRVTTLFRRVFRRNCPPSAYRRLNPPRCNLVRVRVKPFSNLISWTRRLRTKAKAILSNNKNSGRGFIRVGQEPILEKPAPIPKGHMAVYVGRKDGDDDFQRVFVPVVFFNHPLFGDLLKESEREYGFDHPGGITIPCRVSEFETRIKAVQCTRKLISWKKSNTRLRIA